MARKKETGASGEGAGKGARQKTEQPNSPPNPSERKGLFSHHDLLAKVPTLAAFVARIGAVQKSFRQYVVYDDDVPEYGNKRRAKATIKIANDGTLTCRGAVDLPTKEEAEAIKVEIAKADWPTSIAAQRGQLPPELKNKPKENVFEFASSDGTHTRFVQHRIEPEDSPKKYLPWSFWSDGDWRNMEPDDDLPLYNLDLLKDAVVVYVHEGAKAARAAQRIVDEKSDHPWATELRRGVHIGWPGGAPNPDCVDWAPVKKLSPHARVVIVADHDQLGEDAVSKISSLLRRPMTAVLFDDRFPPKFDLADDWPDVSEWWRGPRYVGPTLDDLSTPATWATTVMKNPAGEGRPITKVRDQFAEEWLWVAEPHVFVHREQSNRMLPADVFKRCVRPFSNAEDTARLLVLRFSSQCAAVAYRPHRPEGRGHRAKVITIDGQRCVNTFRPSDVLPVEGDAGPWLRFMEHLVPDKGDRHELYRWCATLIARPEVRMRYGVLLISETQGVGKTTLGEAILAPLVGPWNVSCPSETQVVDSAFNEWVGHKRLTLIQEIYSGHSRTGYDRLKSVVTDKTVDVNRKFLPSYTVECWCHVVACSNSKGALHLDDHDRRWLVPRVIEETKPVAWWHDLYAWIYGAGLGAIADWADNFLLEHNVVATGDHAPMTTAKAEVIAESRSEGQRLAYDLAVAVAHDNKKVVLRVDEVRSWIATERGMQPDNQKLERPLTIRKAMKAGGLVEPKHDPNKKEQRMMADGRPRYLLANFEIKAGTTWDDIKEHHKKPGDLVGL